MRNLDLIALLLLILIGFSSCSTKKFNMLSSLGNEEQIHPVDHKVKIPRITLGQDLCITVTGLNEESAQYFRTSKEREGATGIECLIYKVDEDGKVDLPLIGKIPLAGMSLSQAEEIVTKELESMLREPRVRIEFEGFEINVLGEANQPGQYAFPNGEVTILEAIARAGGVTTFGRRDNILLIRKTDNSIIHKRIDLTQELIWETDYYYLHAEDVLMIESNKGQVANSKNITTWSSVTVGLGTIAAILFSR